MKIIKLAIISLMIVFCSFGIAYAFTFNKADDLRTNLAFELDAYAVFGDVSITNITIERDYEIVEDVVIDSDLDLYRVVIDYEILTDKEFPSEGIYAYLTASFLNEEVSELINVTSSEMDINMVNSSKIVGSFEVYFYWNIGVSTLTYEQYQVLQSAVDENGKIALKLQINQIIQ
ncbi:hypothetical protein [Acholeplasma hippikon]|uniref:Uncharacterized protein n=1 Tax=Acholeplasma hippikon TaxID=264636 RepID=A0A449BLC6_9MOLU|nr:hypothetical protein [Acholeplasma hippikon]VEU83241.1 Uncharacterised protein [Acholeplasma hippikon]